MKKQTMYALYDKFDDRIVIVYETRTLAMWKKRNEFNNAFTIKKVEVKISK